MADQVANVLGTGLPSLYYTKNTNDEKKQLESISNLHILLHVRSRCGCLLFCQTFSCNCISLFYILKPGYDLFIHVCTRITAATLIQQRSLLKFPGYKCGTYLGSGANSAIYGTLLNITAAIVNMPQDDAIY